MSPMRSRSLARMLAIAVSLVAAALVPAGAARAEASEVRIAQQFGVNYLPLTVMRERGLVEKHAQRLGLGSVKVSWLQFGAGNVMNEALFSGTLDFASGGVGPLLKVWDRTKGNMEVRGVASLGSMPLYLNTTNPKVKSVADFGPGDKIALPAVKVSIQAIVLQMAAAKAFGIDHYAKLDELTVSMKHPDAMAALTSGKTEINAHFANSPFQEQELQNPGVRRVLNSYEVLGGPSTLNSVYATKKFVDANPKLYRAVLDALKDAVQIINQDKRAAAQLYVEAEKSKLSPDFVQKILEDPDFVVTTTPKGIMKYAEFMHKVKGIRNLPASWKDVYFEGIHDEQGD